MGGSVAVTLREADGTEHRMCRGTNPIPHFVNNLHFINSDPDHLKRYLAPWIDMSKDYERHRDAWEQMKTRTNDLGSVPDEPFELDMTSAYAPYPFLAPHDYGLIVLDMKENYILSCQGYSALGDISAVTIRNDMTSVAPGRHVYGNPQPKRLGLRAFHHEETSIAAVRFRELLEDGRITHAEHYNDPALSVSLNGKPLNEIAHFIDTQEGENFYFPVIMSPFRVITYQEHDAHASIAMRQKIIELGFSLSERENEIWQTWINDYAEEH